MNFHAIPPRFEPSTKQRKSRRDPPGGLAFRNGRYARSASGAAGDFFNTAAENAEISQFTVIEGRESLKRAAIVAIGRETGGDRRDKTKENHDAYFPKRFELLQCIYSFLAPHGKKSHRLAGMPGMRRLHGFCAGRSGIGQHSAPIECPGGRERGFRHRIAARVTKVVASQPNKAGNTSRPPLATLPSARADNPMPFANQGAYPWP